MREARRRARITAPGSSVEPARRLVEALLAVEAAILACPAGPRRRAAVELVVGRVRRLVGRRVRSSTPPPSQLDLEELLGK